MLRTLLLSIPIIGLMACTSGGGREVAITAEESACSPTSVTVAPGEKITFVVQNNTKGDRELEGTEGTKLEEVVIPSGRSRKVNYTAPNGETMNKLKCYIPGGPATLIDVKVTKTP